MLKYVVGDYVRVKNTPGLFKVVFSVDDARFLVKSVDGIYGHVCRNCLLPPD